jgi:hypothetical protein
MRLRLLGLILACLLPVTLGCRQGDKPSSKKPTPPAPPKVWTSEEIAKDPAGYLQSQDGQVEQQIQERNTRLTELQVRRSQIQEKQGRLSENVKAIQNVHDRMEQGIKKADEEDRWPARIMGKAFDRDRAVAIQQSCKQYIQDRQPLAQTYEETLAKLTQMESQMSKQVADLGRLRERIALDIERIRVNQGIAELGELRKAETELASFSKMLGTLDENAMDAASVAAKQEPPKVNVDDLLK